MRALEIWYDAIDVERFLQEMEAEETRERVKERLKKARERTRSRVPLPQVRRAPGSTPTIADDPPLIFHPTADIGPGVQSRIQVRFRQLSGALWLSMCGRCFDRYQFCDLAMKVVGVGSVGTQCAIALFMASGEDPIFLQVKEANASVLEPYVGKSLQRTMANGWCRASA